MAVGVRVFFVGLVLSVLLALFATGTSRNFTQEFLKSEAVELLSDFPELEVQVDGRDMTLSGVPQRRHGDGLAEALQRVSTLYGVRTFSNLISTKDLEEPAAVIIKDEDLAGLARFTPSDFQVVKLETGSVIDFAAAIQVAVMPEWTPDEGDDPCLLSLGDTFPATERTSRSRMMMIFNSCPMISRLTNPTSSKWKPTTALRLSRSTARHWVRCQLASREFPASA
jgi:hypothetical protein